MPPRTSNLCSFVWSFALLFSFFSPHESPAAQAVIRAENGGYSVKNVDLRELSSSQSYLGKHFKIVEGESEEALPLKSGDPGDLDASNVYYHLELARDHFEKLGLPGPGEPVTVRVRMSHAYSKFEKFGQEEQFNASQTIRGTYLLSERRWDEKPEIWFHKPRTQKRWFQPWFCYFKGFDELVSLSFLCTTEPPFDSAKVPEVIYHEYSHFALGTALGHTTVVNEALADYFAASIEDTSRFSGVSRKWYPRAARYELSNQVRFSPELEKSPQQRHAAILLAAGVLWDLRARLGQETSDKLVIHASRILGKTSLIQDLVESLRQSCDSQECMAQVSAVVSARGL